MKHFTSFKELTSGVLEFIKSGTDDPTRFNDLALALLRLQFENVPAYRKFCEHRSPDILSVRQWTQIPAIPTTSFKEFELSSLPPQNRSHTFHSSGTTEQRPSRHFHSDESLAIYETSLMQWFSKNFLHSESPHLRFISLTPAPAVATNSSLAHMFGTIAKEYKTVFTGGIGADGGWVVNTAKTIGLIEMFCSQQEPVAIVGTAFGFVHLLDEMKEKKLRFKLPAGSRILETGGYKGRSRVIPKTELHQLLSSYFGLDDSQIISEYGMSELSSQAYDRSFGVPKNQSRIFHFPPWARVQIISPESGQEVADGETGLVRVFDLANVYSVMAIQTEDLAVRRGNGFELIGRSSEAEPRGCSLMATATAIQ